MRKNSIAAHLTRSGGDVVGFQSPDRHGSRGWVRC